MQTHAQMTLDGDPAPAPRTRKRQTTPEEAALNRRAGVVTDAWAATQTVVAPSARKRLATHQLAKRVLAAGTIPETELTALMVRMGGEGIPITADSLNRERGRGQNGNGQLRRVANGSGPSRAQAFRNPADQSVYDK